MSRIVRPRRYSHLWSEYQNCLRGALALTRNSPPTRTQKRKQIEGLSSYLKRLEGKGAIIKGYSHDQVSTVLGAAQAKLSELPVAEQYASMLEGIKNKKRLAAITRVKSAFDSLHEDTRIHITTVMRAWPEADLFQEMNSACNWILLNSEEGQHLHYFYIEQWLTQAYVDVGGGSRAELETLIRRFRQDCGPGAPESEVSLGTRIGELLAGVIDYNPDAKDDKPESEPQQHPLRRPW